MKFTNGYWLMREEITPDYAVEYADSRIDGNDLYIYAPAKHISGRGDSLNTPMLTVKLSSPMEDVIKVSVVHFAGALYQGPFVAVNETNPYIEITEDDNNVVIDFLKRPS